MNPGCIEVRIE